MKRLSRFQVVSLSALFGTMQTPQENVHPTLKTSPTDSAVQG